MPRASRKPHKLLMRVVVAAAEATVWVAFHVFRAVRVAASAVLVAVVVASEAVAAAQATGESPPRCVSIFNFMSLNFMSRSSWNFGYSFDVRKVSSILGGRK